MPRLKLTIEYDGTHYCGWQVQKKARTVQGEIERALNIIYREKIAITGSGRTDAGVHARNQVAHFDLPNQIPLHLQNNHAGKLRNSINGIIDNDIVVKKIESCPDGFHARYDAVKRTYKYYISQEPIALSRNFAWYISFPLNFTLMINATRELYGLDEFGSFCKTGSNVTNYKCAIHNAEWIYKDQQWVFTVSANRFLYGMVRSIVGLVVLLGSGKIKKKDFVEIINAQDRTKIEMTAPAHGLVLDEITY